MALSHGHLAVECGFSIDKSLLIENLSEKSLISQCIVVDSMKSNDYKPFNIPLTNELIRSVRDAHHKYTEDLLNRKKKEFRRKTRRKDQLMRIL